MENDDIKEGFICPMCMKELVSAVLLQQHFEECHSNDNDKLRNIRGMFGKAKRKFMDKIDGFETAAGATIETKGDGVHEPVLSRGVDPFLWDDQDFGKMLGISLSSHTIVLSIMLSACSQ